MKVKLKGEIETRRVWLNGEELDLKESLKVINNSPTGFNWGYDGSGPAQLALAILLKFMPKEKALQKYHQFKREVIAKLPQSDFETEIEIPDEWLEKPDYIIIGFQNDEYFEIETATEDDYEDKAAQMKEDLTADNYSAKIVVLDIKTAKALYEELRDILKKGGAI